MSRTIESGTETIRSSSLAVQLLVLAYRLRATLSFNAIPDDPNDWNDADAAEIVATLDALRAALWHLDAQLAITPKATTLIVMRALVGRFLLQILTGADMHFWAWSLGRQLAVDPATHDVSGPADYIEMVGIILANYVQTFGGDPADDVIALVSGILDRSPPPEWASGEPRLMLEGIVLHAALQSGLSIGGDIDAALASVERLVGLIAAGSLPDTATSQFSDLIEAHLEDLADDIAELSPEDLGDPAVAEVLAFRKRLRQFQLRLKVDLKGLKP